MQRQIFTELSFFAERKVILRLNGTKSLFLELLRTQILCLVQPLSKYGIEATDAQKLLSQWEKVAKCNLRAKAQEHEKFLLRNEQCSLQCRRQIFTMLSFFAEKRYFRALMHKITCLELLRTQILCLVQLSKLWECEATRLLKSLSQWEKSS